MLKKLICIAFGGLLLLFPSLSHAEITVTVTPDRERYFINDEALFTIEVKEDGFYKDVALDLIDASFPDESTWVDLVKEDIGKYVYHTNPLATEGLKILNVAVYSEDTLQRIMRYAKKIDRAEKQVEKFKVTQATVKNDIAKKQLEKSILRTNGTITEYEEQIVVEKSRGSLATASTSILVELAPPLTAEELLYKAEAYYAQIYDVTYDAVNETYIDGQLVHKDYTKGYIIFPDYYLEISYETEDKSQPISAALVNQSKHYVIDYIAERYFDMSEIDEGDSSISNNLPSYKYNVESFINAHNLILIDDDSDFEHWIFVVEAIPKAPQKYSKIILKIEGVTGRYIEYAEYHGNVKVYHDITKETYEEHGIAFPTIEERYEYQGNTVLYEKSVYRNISLNSFLSPEIFELNPQFLKGD